MTAEGCNWPRCHGSPKPCFAWCKCRCHTKPPKADRIAAMTAEQHAEQGIAEVLAEALYVAAGHDLDRYPWTRAGFNEGHKERYREQAAAMAPHVVRCVARCIADAKAEALAPVEALADEPLLLSSARRMAKTHPDRHIRIVSGSGTTVAGFVTDVDEWVRVVRAEALEAGARQAVEWLRADYEYGTGPEWREQGCEWISDRLTEHRAAIRDGRGAP